MCVLSESRQRFLYCKVVTCRAFLLWCLEDELLFFLQGQDPELNIVWHVGEGPSQSCSFSLCGTDSSAAESRSQIRMPKAKAQTKHVFWLWFRGCRAAGGVLKSSIRSSQPWCLLAIGIMPRRSHLVSFGHTMSPASVLLMQVLGPLCKYNDAATAPALQPIHLHKQAFWWINFTDNYSELQPVVCPLVSPTLSSNWTFHLWNPMATILPTQTSSSSPTILEKISQESHSTLYLKDQRPILLSHINGQEENLEDLDLKRETGLEAEPSLPYHHWKFRHCCSHLCSVARNIKAIFSPFKIVDNFFCTQTSLPGCRSSSFKM